MKTNRSAIQWAALLSLAILTTQLFAAPMGTAFTYQGKLTSGTNTANGVYDLNFVLFDVPSGGTQIRNFPTNAVPVAEGYFLVVLDFGNAFSGAARWLEIWVKTNGAGSYTILTPRQLVSPVPYALMANNASNLLGTVTGDKIASGTVSDSNISASGIDAGKIIGGDLQAARLKVGLGQTLSGFYATIAGGQMNTASGGFGTVSGGGNNLASGWGAAVGGGGGNAATNAEATVAGGSYNLAGGAYANVGGGISNNAVGPCAAISGGSNNVASGDFSAVIGGYENAASGPHSIVGGGDSNAANSWDAAVGGGTGNTASGGSATVAGGSHNTAAGQTSTVAGGEQNQAGDLYSTVGGGYQNSATNVSTTVAGGWRNLAGANAATVSGGSGNSATGPYATVAGGGGNSVGADDAFVGGGDHNTIQAGAVDASIGGGFENLTLPAGARGTIAGGFQNVVGANAATVAGGANNSATGPYSAVGGGGGNTASGNNAFAAGGDHNSAAGNFSFAAGRRANALHAGTFVWADGTNADFSSTSINQFLIRASGGVAIGTSDPGGAALNVAGLVRATAFQGDGSGLTGVNFGTLVTNTITFNPPSGPPFLTPNHNVATGLNADYLDGWHGDHYWQQGGNASVGPGDVLGSTCNSPLEFVVNSQRALRLEPNASGAPNVIGGAAVNSIAANTVGATIAGGGALNYDGQAHSNRVNAMFGSIVGGYGNTINGAFDTIGGGIDNSSAGYCAGVSGGTRNTISPGGLYSHIGGGMENTNDAYIAAIGGGTGNQIGADADYSCIGGGLYNAILTYASRATIGGGEGNVVEAPRGTIPGGTAAVAHNYGQWAYASGVFQHQGDAQASLYVLRGKSTSNQGYQEIFLDGSQARLRVPTNAVWTFHVLVVGYVQEGGDVSGFEAAGVVRNVNGHTVLAGGGGMNRLAGFAVNDNFIVSADPYSEAFLLEGKAPDQQDPDPLKHESWVARVETVELTP